MRMPEGVKGQRFWYQRTQSLWRKRPVQEKKAAPVLIYNRLTRRAYPNQQAIAFIDRLFCHGDEVL